MKQNMWQRGGNPEHLVMRVPVDGAHSVVFRSPLVYEYRQPDIPTDETIAQYEARNKSKYQSRIAIRQKRTDFIRVHIEHFECACCKRLYHCSDSDVPSVYDAGICNSCLVYLHKRKNGDNNACVEFSRYPTMQELTDIVEMGVLHKDVSMVFHVLKQHYEASK